MEQEIPASIKDVQFFLGFANFYQQFIEEYSRICTPPFNLLKTIKSNKLEPATSQKGTNNASIDWTPTCQQLFEKLKFQFCSILILKHFNPTLYTILETNASDYIISSILSQQHLDSMTGNSILYPVAFLLEKMLPTKCNYGIGDKELLAIIAYLKNWHIYLYSTPFIIYTDYHNLQNLGTKALLNRRWARWTALMAQFDIRIVFRPVKANGKVYTLSCQSGALPIEDKCG